MNKHWTLAEIETANRNAGLHWFDPETLRFFRTRLDETVYIGPGGVFFVSSEQFVSSNGVAAPRRYSVREFNPETAAISTVGEFNVLTKAQAIRRAKVRALKLPLTPLWR